MAAFGLERIGATLRRWWWVLAILAFLFAAYTAGGFLLVPRLAKSSIESYVEKDLKRHVSIGELTFNPFTFAAEVSGFALTESDGAPLASFDLLHVDFLLSSIFTRTWTFKQISLDRPNLDVLVNADGSLNLAKLAPPSAEPAAANVPASIPAVRIGTLAVRNGRVGLEDRSRSQPFATTLTPIAFTLTEFRTAPNFQNEYRFEASTTAGEQLAWSGQFSVRPLGSAGKFTVGSLKAATIASYLQDALPFALASGSLDLEGEYRVTLADQMGLQMELPTLKLHDVGVAPKAGGDTTAWISVPETTLSGITVALPDRKIVIARIDVDNPSLSLWREPDGQPNLLRLLPATAPAASATAAAPPAFSLSVGTIAVRAASITAEDRTTRPAVKFTLAPAELTVSGYSTDPEDALKVDANITVNGKGRVTAQGDIRLAPLTTNMAVEIANIDLAPLQPYIARTTAVQLLRGQLSAKGKLGLNPAPAKGQPRLQLAGNVTLANLATRDVARRQDFIKWQRLELTGIDFRQGPDSLAIDRVQAVKPYGKVVISPEQTLNVVAVLNPPRAPQARERAPVGTATTRARARLDERLAISTDQNRNIIAVLKPSGSAQARPGSARTAPAPARPMPIRVKQVAIEDGSMDFADFSIQPNFAAGIVGLKGTVAGLSSAPNTRAQVKLTGSVDRYAPVDISGQVNLLSAAVFTDIAMNFRNMELTSFNPYSGKYAGYDISKGKLTTELHYKIENRKLDLQHHIVLDQLEFGEATNSKDAVPLPVRLAVALLKDRNGIIDINLPVSGSMDDPQFRVGPIIWQALIGLLTKIVTAPFAIIGSLFGGGDELSYVDFAPGSAMLAPAEAEKIEKLASALAERPQLRLDIPLKTLTPSDDAALSEAAFDEAAASTVPPPAAPPPSWLQRQFQRQGQPAAPPLPEQQRLAILTQLYEQQIGSPPVFPMPVSTEADPVPANIAFLEGALRSRFAATQASRDALGRARADAVQAAILNHPGIMPERVFLTERDSGKGAAAAARMELSLQ